MPFYLSMKYVGMTCETISDMLCTSLSLCTQVKYQNMFYLFIYFFDFNAIILVNSHIQMYNHSHIYKYLDLITDVLAHAKAYKLI